MLSENLRILEKTFPDVAIKLRNYRPDENETVLSDFCEEAQKYMSSADIDDVGIIYVYGIGEGWYYDALVPWLRFDERRQIVFLEDSIEALKTTIATKRANDILKDKQAHIYYLGDNLEESVGMITSLFVFMKPAVTALRSYKKKNPKKYSSIFDIITHDSYLKDGTFTEFVGAGHAFFMNFYRNITILHEAYRASALYGAFKDVPAIVCGAGPSLEKHFDTIKNIGGRAVIAAGGSAMNTLNANGVTPHFGGGVDPNDAQYDRISTNTAFDVPYFYRNRMNHKALKAIHGKKLYVNRCAGYSIAEWFEEKVGIADDNVLNEGYNVIHLLIEILGALGCNPIIFAGMDLAYTGMKAYAPGVGDDTITHEKIEARSDVDGETILAKDINGNDVITTQKWRNEAMWTEKYAKDHKKTTFLNATEGGIGFEGIENITLDDAIARYLTKEYDIKSIIDAALEDAHMPPDTKDIVENSIEELEKSLENTIELLDVLAEENEKIKGKVSKGGYISPEMQTGRGALCEADLRDEVAYNYILKDKAVAITVAMQREYLSLNDIADEKERTIATLDLNSKKMVSLKILAMANLEMLRHVKKEKNNDDSTFTDI